MTTTLLPNCVSGRWQAGTGAGTTLVDPVLGTPLDADRAVIDLGPALALSDDTEVTLGYTGTLGNHSNDHAVRLMGVFEL